MINFKKLEIRYYSFKKSFFYDNLLCDRFITIISIFPIMKIIIILYLCNAKHLNAYYINKYKVYKI